MVSEGFKKVMNKKTKTYQSIIPCYDKILTGTMLCIDPSTGSRSSLPGFALFENGQLFESGVITVDINLNRSKKLYEISRTIREDFDPPDVLVVEYIPPVTYGTGNRMNGVSLMALQKAIGSIIAAHPVEHLLEIPASAWRNYKPDNYIKSDEMDAITLGLCAVSIAKHIKDT
jgi:hypothetical protein